MMCPNCGCDKFTVMKVFRDSVRRNKRWYQKTDADTRYIICDDCGQRYITETKIIAKILYENFKKKEVEIEHNREN